jgi:hypothetical protein
MVSVCLMTVSATELLVGSISGVGSVSRCGMLHDP